MSNINIPESVSPFGTEGSGCQKKFWMGDRLIKFDSKYHESEKEVSAYKLGEAFGLQMVEYTKKKYLWGGECHNGCECKSFLSSTDTSVPIYNYIENLMIPRNISSMDYFDKTVGAIAEGTGLEESNVKDWLLHILSFDYLICNEDRHLGNIELIYSKESKTYRFSPIFDNGRSFLGRNSMPLGGIGCLQGMLNKFKSSPFSSNPKKNLVYLDDAKDIILKFSARVSKEGLLKLPINDFHKKVVLMQYKNLIGREWGEV